MQAVGRNVFRYEQLLSDCCIAMYSLSWVRCFIWVFLHTSIEYQGADGTNTILNPDECVVRDPEGNKYNITMLRNDNGRPRFQASNDLSQPGVFWQFSYNPCISFSLGPKEQSKIADCQSDVAMCMWLENHAYHKIAEQSQVTCGFHGKDKTPMLHYTGDGFIKEIIVLLKCNKTKVTKEQADFDIWQDDDAAIHFFNLTHICACPDECLISPSQDTTKDTNATRDSTITVIYIVSGGVAVVILALIVIWLVRKRQDNDPYVNIDGQHGAGVDYSDNDFPDTSEGTSGRGSASVTRLSPMSSSCSDITVPNKEKKDNLNSKIKTYTEALC